MEKTHLCFNCSQPLPINGFFCGSCLTQFKCKSCDSFLQKNAIGCIICGAHLIENNNKQNANTFRLHETATDRIIEATFSDAVGKDLSGILRDTYSKNRIGNPIILNNVDNTEARGNAYENTIVNNHDNDTKITTTTSEYPTLKAIAMKNLPNSEKEWVVVYSFYASDFGNETFTRQNLIEKYTESNRYSKDRARDLNTYIKRAVQANFINPLENEYSILAQGVEKAKEIISRTTSSPTKVKTKTSSNNSNELTEEKNIIKPKKSTSVKNPKRLPNINFEPEGKESLKSLFEKYNFKNDKEKNLFFTYYLDEILNISDITFDHIYSSYDVLNLRISENLPQTIRNTASKTGWIEINNSKISISTKGRNQIKSWNSKI